MIAKRCFLPLLKHSQAILFLAIVLFLLGLSPKPAQAMSDPPNPPKLISPPDRVNLSTVTPTFSWTAEPGASFYFLEITADSLFGSSMIDYYTSATSYTPRPLSGLKYGRTYYWRVTAFGNGMNSTPSPVRRF